MKKRIVLLLAVVVACSAVVACDHVFADGYGAQESGDVVFTDSGGGGSSSSNNCTQNSPSYTDYYVLGCSGVSWMYFEYQGGENNKKEMPLYNYPTSGKIRAKKKVDGKEKDVSIPKQCAEAGGFWHFGINGKIKNWKYKNRYQFYTSLTGSTGSDRYSVKTNGGWGHWTLYYPNKGSYKTKTEKGETISPSEQLFYDNKEMYRATKIAPNRESVLKYYKAAYPFINPGETYSGSSMPNDVFLFCYGENMGHDAEFKGHVTANISSGNVSKESTTDNPGTDQTLVVTGNEYTVTFKHEIERKDTYDFKVDNSWSTSLIGSNPSYSANAHGEAKSGKKETKAAKKYTVREYSYSGKIFAGQTITYCETLNFESLIYGNGDTSKKGSKKACIKIKKAEDECSSLKGDLSGIKYNHSKGYNYGQIGVKNGTLGGEFLYYGSKDTSGVVSIFARPGDEVRFEHNLCAGGFYARAVGAKETVNGSYRYTGDSDSTGDAGVKSRYLFGEQVSTWNDNTKTSEPRNFLFENVTDANILDKTIVNSRVSPGENNHYNNCLTGGSTTRTKGFYKIAGGTNADACDNRVKTLDAGHTIKQSLTWTNLGYEDGVKSGGNDVTAEASVKVPYNYTLAPYVENGAKVAYLGESITMNPGVVVRPRKNTIFSEGNDTYATISKPSTVRVSYVHQSANGTELSRGTVESSSKSDYRLNKNGLLEGNGDDSVASNNVDNGGTKLNGAKIAVTDGQYNVGDKICVEIAVYPADSHDQKTATSVNGGGTNDIALTEGSNSGDWATAISCATVAKKPTMSVESSNAYSASKFKTANYAKMQGGQSNRFGSWSEYGVFGTVETSKLFASGAALGYSRAGYPSMLANEVRADNDANNVATSANSNECTFMTQTFANAECKSSETSIGGVTANQYEQRLKDRYMTKSGKFTVNGLPAKQYGSEQYYDVSGYNSADVIVEPSGVVRFDSKNNLYISSLPNLTDSQFTDKGITSRNRTIVYSAPERNIVIDGNLNEDSGAKGTIDSLTQVVIFAKNVYITNNPTYINAIIIADEVNTCKYIGETKMAIGGRGTAETIGSNQCNQALRFDAPVLVKKLILNRTAGADSGIASIRRAEIFNLNMANYLWSFNQMSRQSQAVTTYSRELPPRY